MCMTELLLHMRIYNVLLPLLLHLHTKIIFMLPTITFRLTASNADIKVNSICLTSTPPSTIITTIKPPKYSKPHDKLPHISLLITSIVTINCKGLCTDPWRRPTSTLNQSTRSSRILTALSALRKKNHQWRPLTKHSSMPAFNGVYLTISLRTQVKRLLLVSK